jgi:phage shock protein A
MEWLKVRELRGELRAAHAENARLRQQVEMATVLEKIAPESEIGALLADAAAVMREAIEHIYSQAQHIQSLQNKLSQAAAEVERLTALMRENPTKSRDYRQEQSE